MTTIDFLKNFSSSYLAFSFAEALTYPLFAIRNNYIKNSTISMFSHYKILKKNGIYEFYKGAPYVYLRQGLGISVKFSLYTIGQKYYDKNSFLLNVLNSLTVCNLSALIEHPIDVLALNKSIETKENKLIKTNFNARNLYSGFCANVPKQSIGALVLPLYQETFKSMNNYFNNFNNILVSSFLVSTSLTALTYPADYLRMHKIIFQKYNIAEIRKDYKKLYLGSSVTFIRNGVHLFVFMSVIELIKQINNYEL